MNISKAKLEELFVDELARLQPTVGFMRLVKDRVLHASTAQRIAEVERSQKAIREKLNRLDEAFLYERTIDIDTYDRHRDKLREELTLAQKVCFPEGVRFDGKTLVGTGTTLPVFQLLKPCFRTRKKIWWT